MKQRELAEEESALWDQTPKSERGRMIGVFWNRRDGRGDNPVEHRRAVYTAHSDALWAAVGNGMPIQGASRIAIVARKLKLPVEEVLEKTQALATEKQLKVAVAARLYAEQARRPVDLEESWKKLRADAEHIARRMLSGTDTVQVNKHITGFVVEVEAAVGRLRRVLREAGHNIPKRTEVVGACRLLGVPPPRKGALADTKLFRKQAQRLRVEYHADRLGAAYDHERYVNVGTALEILENYNEALERGTT